ncbi:MAG: MtrB/PioB family outer membrane beta-barrel protein, partial [Gallionella sp.]
MSNKNVIKFQMLPIAAAILLAYSPAYAEVDSELQGLMSPESFVSIGVAGQNSGNDAIRFSQYTGLNQSGSVLLDGEYNKRDDATGLWTTFSARNLGLDTRELSFSQNKQGDWKYQVDYNEIVRRDPYVIHTGMTGIGTATPTI